MKTVSLILPAALALALLAACEEESRPRIRHNPGQTGSNNFGYNTEATPGTATDFVTDATPTPTPDPMATDTTGGTTSPPTSTTPTSGTPTTPGGETRALQYGTPVAGKPGFVTSPYAPYAGFVDVRGFPPNTEVKDPFSGKIFLVP